MDGRELELEGNTYIIGKMAPRSAFHVARRISPVISALENASDGDTVFSVIADFLSKLSDEEANYILDNCLLTCKRKNTAGGWAPVMNVQSGPVAKIVPMFIDMTAQTELNLTINVIKDNILSFFTTSPLQPATETAAK